MIWQAGHGHACEVELNGTQLRAGRGPLRWEADIAAASTKTGFHHWGLARGTTMQIIGPGNTLVIGGEGYLSPELDYQAPLAGDPDIILTKLHFEELLAKLPKGLVERTHTLRTYWLWKNGLRPLTSARPALLAFPFIFAAAVALQIVPKALGASLAVACLVTLVFLLARHFRQAKRPTMGLTIGRNQLSLVRADTGAQLGTWALDRLAIRSTSWSPPTSSKAGSTATLDLPSVVVEGISARPLTIGASTYWSGTAGPKSAAPLFLVSPACWPSLAEMLLAKPLSPGPAGPNAEARGSSD